MRTKHWHVLSGLEGGYMPDNNDVYQTKEAAIRAATHERAAALDEGYRHTGGSIYHDGYCTLNDGRSLDWLIEVVPCDDPNCQTDADGV